MLFFRPFVYLMVFAEDMLLHCDGFEAGLWHFSSINDKDSKGTELYKILLPFASQKVLTLSARKINKLR